MDWSVTSLRRAKFKLHNSTLLPSFIKNKIKNHIIFMDNILKCYKILIMYIKTLLNNITTITIQ